MMSLFYCYKIEGDIAIKLNRSNVGASSSTSQGHSLRQIHTDKKMLTSPFSSLQSIRKVWTHSLAPEGDTDNTEEPVGSSASTLSSRSGCCDILEAEIRSSVDFADGGRTRAFHEIATNLREDTQSMLEAVVMTHLYSL